MEEDKDMEMLNIYDTPKQSKDNKSFDDHDTTIESLKHDLKRIKQLLLSLGLLLAILLAVSLIVAVIAAIAYSKPAGSQVRDNNVRNIVSSELFRILNESVPDQDEKINFLQQLFMKNLSTQLEKLYLFQTNLSLISDQVGTMKGRLDGLDLLLNTDLDSVREELVSLSNISEITSTRMEIADLRTDITNLHNLDSQLNTDLGSIRSQLTSARTEISNLQNAASSNSSMLTADIEMVRRDVSSLQTSTSNSINSVRTQISTLSTTHSSDNSSLSSQITNLQQQTTNSFNGVTNQINTLSATHSRDNSSFTNWITSLQRQTTTSLNGVTSQINTLSTTHSRDNSSLTNWITSFQQQTTTSLNGVTNQINTLSSTHSRDTSSLSSQITSLESRASSLSGSISTINTRLSRSVNLYQNCYNITQTCTLQYGSGAGAEYYKPYCQTSYLSIHYSGYQTMDMRCEFSRERAYWAIEVSSLQRSSDGNSVRCKCDLADPNSSGHTQVDLPYTINCILVVTRCPKSQRVVSLT